MHCVSGEESNLLYAQLVLPTLRAVRQLLRLLLLYRIRGRTRAPHLHHLLLARSVWSHHVYPPARREPSDRVPHPSHTGQRDGALVALPPPEEKDEAAREDRQGPEEGLTKFREGISPLPGGWWVRDFSFHFSDNISPALGRISDVTHRCL